MRQEKLEKINWTEVESSNVGTVFFDEPTQTVCVKFLNGSLYSYIGINQEIYMGLVHAPSVGKYLNNVIKAFPFTRWDTEEALLSHLNI